MIPVAPILIGKPAELAFELTWPATTSPEVAGLGWCSLRLWVAGRLVWAGEQSEPIAWSWIDLVEHLGRAWGHFEYEETAPFGLTAPNPGRLREPRYMRNVVGQTRLQIEDAIHAFQARHDLAAGLKGLQLTPVWLVREGAMVHLHAAKHDVWASFADTAAVLTGFVEEIRRRTTAPKPRAADAFAGWETRHVSDEVRTRLRTSMTKPQRLAMTPQGVDPDTFWENDAIAVAARLTQALRQDTREALLLAISGAPKPLTPELDKLRDQAGPFLDAVADEPPFTQGHQLALWLRGKLGIKDTAQPEALLAQWDVHVADLPRLETAVDAVACWGAVGPAVFINPAGRHSNSPASRRATLAHEIAHLILDRGRFLTHAEVFGGATPDHLEKRARAFAAELLLPRDQARIAVTSYPDIESAAKHLQTKYKVSREVVGWQIKNGGAGRTLTRAENLWIDSWANLNRSGRPQPGIKTSPRTSKTHSRPTKV